MRTYLPINSARIETPFGFSQSSIQDYSDCPRRFQLRYLAHLSWPAVELEPVAAADLHQREGRAFHRLVQQSILGVPIERLDALANTPDLKRWWKNYRSSRFDLEAYACRTELALTFPVGEHRLVAKYDLLALRDGEVIIYDWKTSTNRPSNEWLAGRWQTRVYRAILAKAGAELNGGRTFDPQAIRLVYWFSGFPDEPAIFQYDASQLNRDWSAIEKVVQEISSEQGFPQTDERSQCRFCVYRSYCDRGDRAATLQEVPDESLEEDTFQIDFEQVGEIEF